MSLQCPSTSFNTLFSFLPKAIEALVYKLWKKKKKKKGNVFLYISTERRLPEIFIIRKCAINRRCIIIGKGIQTFYWSYFFIFFFLEYLHWNLRWFQNLPDSKTILHRSDKFSKFYSDRFEPRDPILLSYLQNFRLTWKNIGDKCIHLDSTQDSVEFTFQAG